MSRTFPSSAPLDRHTICSRTTHLSFLSQPLNSSCLRVALMPKGRAHAASFDCFAGREIEHVIAPPPSERDGHVSPRKRQPGLTGTLTHIEVTRPARVSPQRSAPSTSQRCELQLPSLSEAGTQTPSASCTRDVGTATASQLQQTHDECTSMDSLAHTAHSLALQDAASPAATANSHEVPRRSDKGVSYQACGTGEDRNPELNDYFDLDGIPLNHKTRRQTGEFALKTFEEGNIVKTAPPTQVQHQVQPAWWGNGEGSDTSTAQILDVYGQPLRTRTHMSAAPSPEVPSPQAEVLDVDGRPLRGRSRAAPMDPVKSPGGSGDLVDHFSSRRKPAACAPANLSLFDSDAAPQYFVSDSSAGDLGSRPFVPLTSRGRVQDAPASKSNLM